MYLFTFLIYCLAFFSKHIKHIYWKKSLWGGKKKLSEESNFPEKCKHAQKYLSIMYKFCMFSDAQSEVEHDTT